MTTTDTTDTTDKNKNLLKGLAHYHGIKCEVNIPKALEFFRIAAEEKDSDAMFYLGDAYANGEGVEMNWDTAFEWWKLAQLALEASKSCK